VAAAFRVQITALVEAGVDIICIETMTDLTEATLAIQAAKQVSDSIPVMATMTFDRTPKGFFTIMGVDVERAAAGLAAAGADVIGSNCGNGIDNMVSVAAAFAEHSKLPLIIQANAGLPEMKGGQPVYSETPAYMAARVPQLLTTGVSIIGGCCGTTPEHTRAIRRAVDSYRARS
jgi:5-methyltetrahydrofolate--homocysteine methyltransferase